MRAVQAGVDLAEVGDATAEEIGHRFGAEAAADLAVAVNTPEQGVSLRKLAPTDN